jgi:N-acetylmuramoyl-L-alanine amidase
MILMENSIFRTGKQGTNESLKVLDCTRANSDTSYYYKEETVKKKIILHFTLDYLKGDIATLTTNHVSVPFVVGRSGLIYNLFASKYWSYHLGPGASGGNTAMSKDCICVASSAMSIAEETKQT